MVGFADIQQTFGFDRLKLGRWVTKDEATLAAPIIFDAFADLAYLLNLPPKAIGLRQSLSLAFGSGGRQGVQAHYNSLSRELALAKHAGAGALAHEFWHGFDHYIAPKAYDLPLRNQAVQPFASDCWQQDLLSLEHPLNDRLLALFAIVMQEGAEPSSLVLRSKQLDKRLGRYYFSQPTELMARAFEAALEFDNRIANPYLVNGTRKGQFVDAGVYPDDEHLVAITRALLAYFEPLGRALSKQGI
ncbi:hypothetical protein FJQ87_11675 [Shewanella sp. SNU WT4]|nr:hypothetical protein FJQ87_11675 [Shewanella sp. SNU WT4]